MNLLNFYVKYAHWMLSKQDVEKISNELSELNKFPSKEEALSAVKGIFDRHQLYREGQKVGYLDADTHEFHSFDYLKFNLGGKKYDDYVLISPIIEIIGKAPSVKKFRKAKRLSGFTFDPDEYNNGN